MIWYITIYTPILKWVASVASSHLLTFCWIPCFLQKPLRRWSGVSNMMVIAPKLTQKSVFFLSIFSDVIEFNHSKTASIKDTSKVSMNQSRICHTKIINSSMSWTTGALPRFLPDQLWRILGRLSSSEWCSQAFWRQILGTNSPWELWVLGHILRTNSLRNHQRTKNGGLPKWLHMLHKPSLFNGKLMVLGSPIFWWETSMAVSFGQRPAQKNNRGFIRL